MPSPVGASSAGGESNDTPNWLQQLKKNRSSTKRENTPLSVAPKPEETQSETPDWRAGLRKNTKSGEATPSRPPQPILQGNKPINHFQSLKSPVTPLRPDSPSNQAADDTNNKFIPPMFQKSKSEANVMVS